MVRWKYCIKPEAEFAYPHWVFGLSTYGFIDQDNLVCTYSANGSWHLGKIDLQTKQFQAIESQYTNISDLQTTKKGEVLFAEALSIDLLRSLN